MGKNIKRKLREFIEEVNEGGSLINTNEAILWSLKAALKK